MTTAVRRALASRFSRWWLAVLFAAASLLLAQPAQAAAGVPADPAAHGYVGFCGIDNQPMIAGSIHDKPFVWKAIASGPAPAKASTNGPVATLYAYQPRPGVQAADWSGDTLTATEAYATTGAPTAQATKLDYSLKDIIDEYPPKLDGLYELRMYFGNRAASAYPDTYAATFVQVSGDRWKIVQGGTVSCDKGKAQSTELRAVGTRAAGTPRASAPFGGPNGTGVPKDARGVPIRRAATSPVSGASATAAATATGSGLAPGVVISDAASGSSGSSSGGDTSTLIAILVAAVVVAGAAAFWWFRYRGRGAGRTAPTAGD